MELPQRKSIRLSGDDYSQAGFYFDSQKSPMDIGQKATNLPAGRQGNKLLRRNVGVPRSRRGGTVR